MKQISHIIIHCSDSKWGSAPEINKWHVQRGFSKIGYHFVVLNGMIKPDLNIASMDGSIEVGRQIDGDQWLEGDEIGAHALGMNANSIGICLIGVNEFTDGQLMATVGLVEELCDQFHIEYENVLGHCETAKSGGKTCPNFNMDTFRKILSGELDYSELTNFIPYEDMFQD